MSLVLLASVALAGADVLTTSLELLLDVPNQRFAGVATLRLTADGDAVTLDAIDLDVDAVRVDGRVGRFTQGEGRLRIELPRRQRVHTVVIRYGGGPSEGLRFEEGAVYTGFDTRRWLPCDFDLGDRGTFALRLTGLPAGWEVVGNGQERGAWWRIDRAHPAYLLGFAAGDLWTTRTRPTGLAVGGGPTTTRDAATLLPELERMAATYEAQSGRALPGGRFDLLFLPGDVAQEKADFALLGEDSATETLNDPREDWLPAHELSHAWWGNTVTAATWADFWMNEALSTYATNTWKRARWGDVAYARELDLSRSRLARLRARGDARALVLDAGATADDAGGTLVYALGFLTLDALRERVGDEAFDAGLRALMPATGERSLSTAELQRAMEAASGHELSDFFEEWVRRARRP